MRKDGYSLVEVSLALLVAGIGLMAVFALFPEALAQSRKSVEATEEATFADYVFAGLLAKVWPGTNSTTAWDDVWVGPLNDSHALDAGDRESIKLGDSNNQKFLWKPWWYGDSMSAYIANYRAATFTYNLRIQDVTTVKKVRLEVWSGDLDNPTTPGKVFYREFVPLR